MASVYAILLFNVLWIAAGFIACKLFFSMFDGRIETTETFRCVLYVVLTCSGFLGAYVVTTFILSRYVVEKLLDRFN